MSCATVLPPATGTLDCATITITDPNDPVERVNNKKCALWHRRNHGPAGVAMGGSYEVFPLWDEKGEPIQPWFSQMVKFVKNRKDTIVNKLQGAIPSWLGGATPSGKLFEFVDDMDECKGTLITTHHEDIEPGQHHHEVPPSTHLDVLDNKDLLAMCVKDMAPANKVCGQQPCCP